MGTYVAKFYRKNDTMVLRTIEADSYDSAKAIANKMGKAMPFGGMKLFTLQVKARVRVRVLEEFGRHCLAEIHGLKEGAELEGLFNPVNKAFDFTWQGEPAMLWVGSNAEIILKE